MPSDINSYRSAIEFGMNPLDIDAHDVERLLAEHEYAAGKHGYGHLLTNPDLPEIDKLSALMEEMGEVAQLLTYDKRAEPGNAEDAAAWRVRLAEELLQMANLALAWHHSVMHGGN